MSEIIASRLQQYVLGKKYSYEYDGKNLGDIKLADLQRKVIIMVDKSNPMYEGTDLDEYVNIASNSIFMHALRFDDMRYAPDMQEITEYNKKNMTIVLPNISADSDNYSAALAFKYGCQMAAMSIQTFDSNLDFYNNFFNQAGTAFVLKPIELRHQPINITVPNPPPASHSYASRDLSSDFYSFKI
jgi:hypothetical protein